MNRQPLVWFNAWLILGWVLVFIVIYQSLGRDVLPPPDIQLGDKWAHLLAYFTLMAWFSQLYLRAWHKWCLLAFIGLGIGLEFIQGLTGYRFMEVADMAANSIGALIAWFVVRKRPYSHILYSVEQRFLVKSAKS